MTLAKADFYFGALLSQLVKSGFAPAIIEGGEQRRIYKLYNDFGEYTVYAKYVSKPAGDKIDSKRWDFTFNQDEIENLQSFEDIEQYMFGFVCGFEALKGSRIALLTYGELSKCLGMDYPYSQKRVSVRHDKGSWNYIVYGTALEEKLNPIKVTRNVESRLEELVTN